MADSYHRQEEGVWLLYWDGASRGNPGLAGAGVVLLDPDGRPLRARAAAQVLGASVAPIVADPTRCRTSSGGRA